ncbi:DUF2249 domain-containing protein [Lederbergia galactosidilytica]|uniref:DUF2249 domain-containing protein n=1 Tax=Lederbergia galactosidilytica TaxID=217031 RepID=A0A0Q9XXK4_9BACI|nr:DUF2249 domain-containing protein [Lederbergia galactosidilytica]KRG09422.1 hypothetical protein ACA29_24040 [Lederbergia galactosidilytica]KRG16178.1 hypothetical protein ACA30_02590 [Virgibacillus soli]MBP1914044.1 uncharacterized protein (DUF2249 family) [Lederbergia galactosidilytica]OAK75608.1 hypothetical protein ABB05_01230 [Lederbergia galactosidilytica]
MTNYAATVIVTEYPPHLKHKAIFETFKKLQPSEAMLIVNDHDPIPLRYQLDSMYENKFDWEYIEQGPDVFQIKIEKI